MVTFPEKKEIFGVSITPTTYEETIALIIDAAKQRQSAVIDFMPVHGLMLATEDKAFFEASKQFDMTCPDGQPVRWALNHFHRTRLKNTVCGPATTWKLCKAASHEGVPVYFYGSTEHVLDALRRNLTEKLPALQIVGMESPPFRPLTADEDHSVIERINNSGAGIVFIGLGCPKQELFAVNHKGKIHAPMLCVGAAFDFHAGILKRSPAWMSKCGMEWLYRLWKEPRRLYKRYLYYNTKYFQAYWAEQFSR
ncbi:WecB/TagA/CpsF family glycosyltransferase [Desulfogranum japonicum]|uniref:WecB/TagA/CpsF family glycosyltransferase n=1 Tax=Desulfogranum japonicum TaxID=231447 RepID=UPI0003FB80E6|nr:WecB/TagA/CpsF family glycosyltransferase [Desulfogranum japonicum]